MSVNPEIFSPWCVRCLAGDGKDHMAHMAEERNRREREARNRPPRLKIRCCGDDLAERRAEP